MKMWKRIAAAAMVAGMTFNFAGAARVNEVPSLFHGEWCEVNAGAGSGEAFYHPCGALNADTVAKTWRMVVGHYKVMFFPPAAKGGPAQRFFRPAGGPTHMKVVAVSRPISLNAGDAWDITMEHIHHGRLVMRFWRPGSLGGGAMRVLILHTGHDLSY
jgi:hypothetical protein